MNITLGNKEVKVNLNQGTDLSIGLRRQENVNAYGLYDPEFKTFEEGGFTGDVNRGGSCNCESVLMVPHGNGTHTECVGHISHKACYISDVLKEFMFLANLISVEPVREDDNLVIKKEQVEKCFSTLQDQTEVIIIRTLPNDTAKLKRRYAGLNPACFDKNVMHFLIEKGIKHLLTDLPSVDHEADPDLLAHHAFWNYPKDKNSKNTITELVYVPDHIKDGLYLLNLQLMNLESDAAPSRPVIYPVLPL
jgi:arylformamidase